MHGKMEKIDFYKRDFRKVYYEATPYKQFKVTDYTLVIAIDGNCNQIRLKKPNLVF